MPYCRHCGAKVGYVDYLKAEANTAFASDSTHRVLRKALRELLDKVCYEMGYDGVTGEPVPPNHPVPSTVGKVWIGSITMMIASPDGLSNTYNYVNRDYKEELGPFFPY